MAIIGDVYEYQNLVLFTESDLAGGGAIRSVQCFHGVLLRTNIFILRFTNNTDWINQRKKRRPFGCVDAQLFIYRKPSIEIIEHPPSDATRKISASRDDPEQKIIPIH